MFDACFRASGYVAAVPGLAAGVNQARACIEE
jgi:hypothetical protein